jgi:hypothetical protein
MFDLSKFLPFAQKQCRNPQTEPLKDSLSLIHTLVLTGRQRSLSTSEIAELTKLRAALPGLCSIPAHLQGRICSLAMKLSACTFLDGAMPAAIADDLIRDVKELLALLGA